MPIKMELFCQCILATELFFKEAEKWTFKSKIWKPKISFFVIKKP